MRNPDLTSYDLILLNTSAGKDSLASMDLVVELARAAGVEGRLVAVHADLGRVEWGGTLELAREHAASYGLRLEIVRRELGGLLQQVEERGKWPGPGKGRWCTSYQKRDQVRKLMTRLVRELGLERPARILNVMGMRADESPARRKLEPFEHDVPASNGRRHVDTWLPIHAWTEADVWARIKASGRRPHRAYSLGMSRLSCSFCVLASRDDLMIAGEANPQLLAEYVALEERIGHDFKYKAPIREIAAALARGERGRPHRDRRTPLTIEGRKAA